MAAKKPLRVRVKDARQTLQGLVKRWLPKAIRRRKKAKSDRKKDARRKVVRALKRRVEKLGKRLKGLVKKLRRKRRKRGPDFNGHPQSVTAAIREVIEAGNRHGLYVTSTTDGTHSPTSHHYSGRAVDLAAPMTSDGIERMKRFQSYVAKRWPGALENFGPQPWYVKNGHRYSGTFPNHHNHNHVAL